MYGTKYICTCIQNFVNKTVTQTFLNKCECPLKKTQVTTKQHFKRHLYTQNDHAGTRLRKKCTLGMHEK